MLLVLLRLWGAWLEATRARRHGGGRWKVGDNFNPLALRYRALQDRFINYAQLCFFLFKHIYFPWPFNPAALASSKCTSLCFRSRDSGLVWGKYRSLPVICLPPRGSDHQAVYFGGRGCIWGGINIEHKRVRQDREGLQRLAARVECLRRDCMS